MKNKEDAVGFVTKRALVTFTRPVCMFINGTAVMVNAAICEAQEPADRPSFSDNPREFRVIGLPDGRKLTKSFNVRVGSFGEVSATVELEDDDLKGLVG
jgi:hypothetical protein